LEGGLTDKDNSYRTAGAINWHYIQGKEGGNWLVGYVPNSPDPKTNQIASGVTVVGGLDLGQHSENEVAGWPWPEQKQHLRDAILRKLHPFFMRNGADAVNALEVTPSDAGRLAVETLSALNQHRITMGINPVRLTSGPPNSVRNSKGQIEQWIAPEQKYLQRSGGNVSLNNTTPASAEKGLILTKEEGEGLMDAAREYYRKTLQVAFDKATQGRATFNTLSSDQQTALASLRWHRGEVWKTVHGRVTPEKQVFEAAAKGDWADAVDTLKGEGFLMAPQRLRRVAEGNLIARSTPNLNITQVGPKQQALIDRVIKAKTEIKAGLQQVINMNKRTTVVD
jgi:hypothetical protein